MPTGTVTYTTVASTAVANADETTYFTYSAASSVLVTGTNILAVEIHQNIVTSTDISFDLEVKGNF
jgi:hypothetical protein